MRIKVLGCSGGVGPGLRTTSLLVGDELLIDAGTGVGDLSLDQMRRIRNVFLTHSHLDHVCGLAFMADNLFDLIDYPVQVHATAETLSALREHVFNWKIWPDFSRLPDASRPLITFHEIAPGETRTVSGCTLSAYRVLHTVPCVGYAVQGAEGTFAFSGDTYASDALWEALNALPRLDHLMIDVAFADRDAELARISRHFTPELLGRELSKLRHRPRLLLTHHKPGCEDDIEKECRVALAGHDYRHLRRDDVIAV
ncbi:MAG TPA: 3',5'-cyclic-nucleotide phosphodiesterase [Candidatus Binatia bacterium]|nr:3',5'-cyclic-nucleotide phosphodiesterase [Candidatus Binatia bacterium]